MAIKPIICPSCGRRVNRNSWIKQEINKGQVLNTEFFCKYCQSSFPFQIQLYETGKRTVGDGYVIVKVEGLGWITEHKYIWEKVNGCPLPKGFVIHHINGDKTDNRIENLIAIPKSGHNTHKVLV